VLVSNQPLSEALCFNFDTVQELSLLKHPDYLNSLSLRILA
jgi:hypothetical protein